MKYLATDVSSFENMISGNYTYVDKTKYIYDLFKGGTRYYFLSRPRRFGKTLLISTLKELFLANKELFKSLDVYNSDYIWNKYCVVHLDFSKVSNKNSHDLEASLINNLHKIAREHNVAISRSHILKDIFVDLIEELSKISKVVILIDEYDKPILDNLHNVEIAMENRIVLKEFYDSLKGLDEHLRAIFITGVTKFSKTSIFSGLNNINDISLKVETALLLGYTSNEIEHYFPEYINQLSKNNKMDYDKTLNNMRLWYNGYSFSELDIKVYNPFSIVHCLNDKKFSNYWFESGTPSFLVNLLKNQYIDLENIESLEINGQNLGTFEIQDIPLVPLLFQTGYLTLASYNELTKKFTLKYPNFEVEESFTKYLVAVMANTSTITLDTAVSNLIKSINSNDIKKFCQILETLFAHIPYTLHIKKEAYYHSLFQFLMSLLSIESSSEILTNKGRIDNVITTKFHIYIFEFKFKKSASISLKQIDEKKYYERFGNTNKKIVLVGLSFDTTEQGLNVECITKNL